MKMKSVILLSFVVALVFSGGYAQDLPEPPQQVPCSGAQKSVGDTFCHKDATCYELSDTGSMACTCNPGYEGDGLRMSVGCVQVDAEGVDLEEAARQKRFMPGMWVPGHPDRIQPCTGFLAVMSKYICDKNAVCRSGPSWWNFFRCVCLRGSGNGIQTQFVQGTGCK